MDRSNLIISPAEYRALLRNDLDLFSQRAFRVLNPATTYEHNWHLELIAAKVQQALDRGIRRLAICLPPRSLKSHIVSIAATAFLLGRRPTARILAASYGEDLAHELSRKTRDLMQSDFYRAIFPATVLSPSKNSVREFHTPQGGYRIALPAGGGFTGRGGEYIIIDDPEKPGEALSDVQRRSVNDWFDNTLYSRLNNKLTDVIIVIMQRLHEDDLIGHILLQEKWELISLPAVAEENEYFEVPTILGPKIFTRRVGELLHPARLTEAVLQQQRETMGSFHYAAQYQQRPAPAGGGMVQVKWFNRFDLSHPPHFDRIIQSWDTAVKSGDLNDYSVCTTWGIKDGKIYLLHVFRKRLDYPDLKRAVHAQYAAFKPAVVLIEDKGTGSPLIQEMLRESMYAVKGVIPTIEKSLRMHTQTAMIENGFVFVPERAAWLDDYLHELEVFPNGRHDDQVDSTSQALEYIKDLNDEPNAVKYYRQGLERMRAQGPAYWL